MCVAPDAAECAPFLGHPFFGATSRISESPKFAIARAAMPIFSASCGSTRMMTGWYVTVLLNLRAALGTRVFVLPKAPGQARASYEPRPRHPWSLRPSALLLRGGLRRRLSRDGVISAHSLDLWGRGDDGVCALRARDVVTRESAGAGRLGCNSSPRARARAAPPPLPRYDRPNAPAAAGPAPIPVQ